MFEKIYKDSIIEKPKFTLLILAVLLLSFGYFTKDFQLDASSDSLLLENDPDLKYLREVNTKYGSKDSLVLTYTPKDSLLASDTIENLTNLEYLALSHNKLSGFIPTELCNIPLVLLQNNKLCPPYPDCIDLGNIGNQNTSECEYCIENPTYPLCD